MGTGFREEEGGQRLGEECFADQPIAVERVSVSRRFEIHQRLDQNLRRETRSNRF